MKKYTRQQSDTYKYTLSDAILRTSPSTTSKVLTIIPEGTKVLVLDSAEDWYQILYNNFQGFVFAPFLSVTKYPWKDVLLRSYPSSQSNPLLLIPAKSPVEVLSTNGDWSSVIYNDQSGYLFSELLTDDGNPPDAYDFTYFDSNMVRFVNDNKIKSPTTNLLTTNLETKYTYVFEKGTNDLWVLLYKWICTVGKPSTPTIKGTFYISGRKPYFGTDLYRVKYATRISGSYYYHSILFDSTGTTITDDRLGMALSHGCIRLDVPNAQWIYDNILDGTAVVIN